MYIKYADYTGKLAKGDIVLMSAAQFANGGDKLTGVPVTITPDGKPPIALTDEPDLLDITPPEEKIDPVLAEIEQLKTRLAKIEEAPTVKSELAAKEVEPIATK